MVQLLCIASRQADAQSGPRDRANGPGAWPKLTRSADVPHRIAHIFEPLLRLLRPAPGRHRAPDSRPALLIVEASAECPPHVPAAPVLHGEDTGLVRPYLLAHEQREQRRRRTPRRALRLAMHGVDTGPLLTRSVEGRA